MANISFNEFMGKLSGKVEGFKTTVQEGKLMSASLQEVIDETLRKNSERIKRCVEEENALDNWAPEHRANDPILDKILEYYDYEPAKKLSGCNEVIGVGVGIGVSSCRQWKGEELISISQDETKEIDIDPDSTMIARDLVEEKTNSCDVQEKEETPWYSRMAPMEATFGVKFLNRYKGEQNNGN